MRYAIFSDIHGNLRAWEAVRRDMEELEADVLVCLGDIVGYGPLPEEVLTAIRGETSNVVLGNHDAAAVGMLNASLFNRQAASVIKWTRSRLSQASKRFLRNTPLSIKDGDLLFVHAEVCEPGRFGYVDSLKSATDNFTAGDSAVTFIGHTHRPTIYELDPESGEVRELEDEDRILKEERRYIVNVGSVGEPRDPEDIRAHYVLYDSDTRELFYRRIAFDVDAYRRDLEGTSLKTTPYFMQVVEHHEALEAELELAFLRDMEAPVTTGAYLQQYAAGGVGQLQLPEDFQWDGKPKPRPEEEGRRMSVEQVLALWLGLILLVAIAAMFIGGPERELAATGDPVERAATGVRQMPEPFGPPVLPEPFGPPAPALLVESFGPPRPIESFGPPLPLVAQVRPPAPPPDPPPADAPTPPPPPATLAHWRMEADSAGEQLVDAFRLHPLQSVSPGRTVEGIAPDPVPLGGEANEAALEIGVWKEPEASGDFALRTDRGFTFEGWLSVAGANQPVFVAGTRPAEGGSWRLDAHAAPRNGQRGSMRFVYEGGGDPVLVRSNLLQLLQDQSYHFAIVWDPDGGGVQTGTLRLYFEGLEVAATPLEHASIGTGQAGEFQLGAAANSGRVVLDELRFTAGSLQRTEFLNLGSPRAEAPAPAFLFDIGAAADLYAGSDSPAHVDGALPVFDTTWIAADPSEKEGRLVDVVHQANGSIYPTPLVVEFGAGRTSNLAVGVHWDEKAGSVAGVPEAEGLFGLDFMDGIRDPDGRLPLGFRVRGLEPGEYTMYFSPVVAGSQDAEIRFALGVVPLRDAGNPTRANSSGMHVRTYRGEATPRDIEWEIDRNCFKQEVVINQPGDCATVVVLNGEAPAVIPFLQIVKNGPSELAVGSAVEFDFAGGSLKRTLGGAHPVLKSISAIGSVGFVDGSVKVIERKAPPPPPPTPLPPGDGAGEDGGPEPDDPREDPPPPPPGPPPTIGWSLVATVDNPGPNPEDFLFVDFEVRAGGARFIGFGIEESVDSRKLARRVTLHRIDDGEMVEIVEKEELPPTSRWRARGSQAGDAPLDVVLIPGRYQLRLGYMGAARPPKTLRIDKLRLDFGPP